MATKKREVIEITAPNFEYIAIRIDGTSMFVQSKFSNRVRDELLRAHEAGTTAKSTKKRGKKNTDQLFLDAQHGAARWRIARHTRLG